MAKRIVHWTDPDYLEQFYEAWGSGQSVMSRQAGRRPKQQEPDPSQSSHGCRDTATSDSREE